MQKRLSALFSGTAALLTLLSLSTAQAQVVVTIEQPGVQSSSVSGITTETFDGFNPGIYRTLNSSIGVYTSPGMAVVAADIVGGAGAMGNYFAVGAQSGERIATLDLNGDADYFGFWDSAIDAQNELQFFKDSTPVYDFDIHSVLDLINMQPNPSAYYGNPNNGQDTAEPFVYVNIFGINGTVFNKIVIQNHNLGSGFEMDNHSVRPASSLNITPEPGVWAMLIIGGASGLAFFRRKRAR